MDLKRFAVPETQEQQVMELIQLSTKTMKHVQTLEKIPGSSSLLSHLTTDI